MIGITRATRVILARGQNLTQPPAASSPPTPLVSSRLLGNNGQDEEDGDSANVFNLLKDRVTQKIGVRMDKDKQNGFKLFAIEEKFDIDRMKLKREMRKLQNLLHPDRFIQQGNLKTQETSLQLSAMVNDFYRTLSNPYERGKYLLSLMTNKNPEQLEESLGKIQLDGEFLARMMDISEKTQSRVDTNELSKLAMQLDSEIVEMTKKLQKDFEAKRIDHIYGDLAKLKFLANCHASLTDCIGSPDDF